MSEKKEDCVNCGDQQLPPDGSIPTPNFPSFMDAPWEDPKNEREENWRLLTILNIPWHEANKITDKEDRKFLMEKAKEVEGFLKYQQMMQMQQQQQQNSPAPSAENVQPPAEPQVEIVKPS